jgi:hypothetical protein
MAISDRGTCLAAFERGGNMSTQSPTANGPGQGPEEPFGDRGRGDETWSPEQDEQGISNRVGDEEVVDADENDDDEPVNPTPA